MKKAVLVIITAVLLLSITSCKKEHTDLGFLNFGNCPQTLVTDNKLCEELNKLPISSADSNGYYNYEGALYYSQIKTESYYNYNYEVGKTYWFKVEPIKWLVLNENDGRKFLLSEKILNCAPVDPTTKNENKTGTTWEHTELREKLNSVYLDSYFSDSEKSSVCLMEIINKNNTEKNTLGGKNTKDYLFLLSLSDIANKSNGLVEGESLLSKPTDYALFCGAQVDENGNGWYWLRSPGFESRYAARITSKGEIFSGGGTMTASGGVRPAMEIRISDK